VSDGLALIDRANDLDAALLDAATLGLSPEETSRRLDGVITPARVITRTRALLAGDDWVSDIEQERLLIRILRERVIELQGAHDLDSIKAQGVIIARLLDQLNRRSAALDSVHVRITAQLGSTLARAVSTFGKLLRSELEATASVSASAQQWDDATLVALAAARDTFDIESPAAPA